MRPCAGSRQLLAGALVTTAVCVVALLAVCRYSLRSKYQQDVYGRTSPVHPSPRCCFTTDCLAATREGTIARHGIDAPKHAFVTSLRSPEYLVLLKDLHCSLRATNPGVPLIVLAVEGELASDIIADVQLFAASKEVPNVEFLSAQPRYSKNWFKLNAWNLTEYESLILLDSDTVVLNNLRHVFDLPTDFAWTYLNAPDGYAYNVGGFIMLRPCAAVFTHLLQLAEARSHLYRSQFAEQSFFAWYFAYTGYRLPMAYNANFDYLVDGLTAGGTKPLVIHFANQKPFLVNQSHNAWEYLCFRYKEHHHKDSRHFLLQSQF